MRQRHGRTTLRNHQGERDRADPLHHHGVELYFAAMERLRRALLPAVSLALLSWTSAAGQDTVARLSGTVQEEGGKPVAGATITATNPDQSPSTFTATSNEKGRFGILGLRRGTWEFAIAAPGFRTARASRDVQAAGPSLPLAVRLVRGAPLPAGLTANLTGADLQTSIDGAEAAARAGDVAAAVAAYRDFLTRIPSRDDRPFRIGVLLEEKGDTAQALEAYRELARVEPDNARAAAAIARLTERLDSVGPARPGQSLRARPEGRAYAGSTCCRSGLPQRPTWRSGLRRIRLAGGRAAAAPDLKVGPTEVWPTEIGQTEGRAYGRSASERQTGGNRM